MISKSSPSGVPSLVLRGGGVVARLGEGLVVVEERETHHRIPFTAIEGVEAGADGPGAVRIRLVAGSGPVDGFVIRQRNVGAAHAFARAVSASVPRVDRSGRVESVPVERPHWGPRQLSRAAAAWNGAGSFLRAAAVAFGIWAVGLLATLVLGIGWGYGSALPWLPALPLLIVVAAACDASGMPYLWLRWVLWRRGISVMATVRHLRTEYGHQGRYVRHAVYGFVDAEGDQRTGTDRHTGVQSDSGTFEITYDPRRPSRVLTRGRQAGNVYRSCLLTLLAVAAGSAAVILGLVAVGASSG